MARGGRARHGEGPPAHWSHALAGLPWITLVLVVTLVVGAVDVLRPNTYAARATVTAQDVSTAGDAAMLLGDHALVGRVEQEIELGPTYRGSLELTVDHERDEVTLHVVATAGDPRLAALSADTAAVLLIGDRGPDELALTSTARVPAEPVRQPNLTWVWVALVALAGALWVEGAHRIWLRSHPAPPRQDAS